MVAIGRNEGKRLEKCLRSVSRLAAVTIYVDSGSTDNSLALAKQIGCDVVELDSREPFTAARARNAGFERLKSLAPDIKYVQFVDGDCEIVDGWLQQAQSFLEAHLDFAVVCGRRRERHPSHSIFNRLCDIEWDTPIGETKACGGDALIRVGPFVFIGGYRTNVIAAEDNELCVRLRAAGWRIWRLDAEMTLHDAAITRFAQWWRRNQRAGYAFAQGTYLHGKPPERHFVKETCRAWLWGVCLPLACLLIGVAFGPWGWIIWSIYPLQIMRLIVRSKGDLGQRVLVSCFYVLGRFPEAQGQLAFVRDWLLRRQTLIIEYK